MSRPGVVTSSFHDHGHGHYPYQHHLGLGHGGGGGRGLGGGLGHAHAHGVGPYGSGGGGEGRGIGVGVHTQQQQQPQPQSHYESVGVGVGAVGVAGVGVEVDHSGLTYRAPLPIRAPDLPTAGGFGNHHPQPQLASVASAGSSSCSSQRPHPHPQSQAQPQHNHHHQHHQQHHHPNHHGRPTAATPLSMADNAYMPSEDELAQMQKMSSDYDPEPTGPLVGERQSSSAITTEYANADSVYRIKTAALPAKYAYFRTCRGDGQCGWRAIAFTYFEALLRVGDANKLEDEEARLNSMGNLLDQAGYSRDVYIDFAEEAWELLRKLASSLRQMDGNADEILLTTFNDQNVSMAIITYFKLLTSAWVQGHADEFRHFVPMGDIKTYCSFNIEASAGEADNVGVAALADAVVKPAGFGLEVWYLDRSPGDEINRSYYSEPTDQNHMALPNAPMLRLLYRPGHYDILYKAEDFPTPIQQSVPPQEPLHVALAGYTDGFVPTASNMTDVMTMIPGLYPTGLGQRWPSYDFASSPSSQPQITPMQPYAPTPTPAAPVTTSHIEYVSPIQAPSHVSHHNPPSHHIQLEQPPVTLPIHPPPPPPSLNIERAAPLAVERGGPFRPSMYELEPGFGSSNQVQPFQTSIFRNSHFNTAHFLNPDFQPEEWSPDAEYATGNKGRHKSTSS